MRQIYTSFKLLIENNGFNNLGREDVFYFQKILDGFLLQIKNTVNIEFGKDGCPIALIKENYFLTSLDKKWTIGFQDGGVLFSYSHDYPDDNYDYEEFSFKVVDFFDKVKGFLKSKSFRLGCVIESVVRCSQEELLTFSKGEDNGDIVQNFTRIVKRQMGKEISEKLNIVEDRVYDINLSLKSVHRSNPEKVEGYSWTLDINTSIEDKSERFDSDEISLFLSDVLSHLRIQKVQK